jgi:hypothetical protein
MIPLEVADLVVIAGRTLDLDTDAVLDLLDPEAAERALTDAFAAAGPRGEAGPGAAPGPGGDAGERGERGEPGRRVDGGDLGDRDDLSDPDDPAGQAAALLDALLRRRPLRHGNRRVALVAMLQFLALNGWELDPGPPAATAEQVERLAAGTIRAGELRDWLAPRLRCANHEATAKEAPMRRWLPVRKRRAGARRSKGMFDRFTDRARRSIQLAQEEARLLRHNYIGTEHLLLGLLREDQGVAAKALTSLGIAPDDVRDQVVEIIGRGDLTATVPIPYTPRAKKVLELSLREALQLGHGYVGTEHLLLGLLREGEGLAALALVNLGCDFTRAREAVLRLLNASRSDEGSPTRLVRMAVPADLLGYDDKLAEVRRRKEAAIDEGDLERAATLRDREKLLLADKLRREREWTAGVDLDAVVSENQRAHHEIERLRRLLRRHGIDPNGGTARSA